MQFLVNATLCASFIMLAVQRRSPDIASRDWLDAFRPTVCMLVVALYLFASLHKLNSAYFSEDGVTQSMYRAIVGGLQVSAFAHLFPTDEAFLALLPPLSILFELGIPILLILRPTRLLGIFIGMAFHAFLSLRAYPYVTDFPVVLGAAYILFLPDRSIDLIKASVLDPLRSNRYFQRFMDIIAPTVLLAIIFAPTALYEMPRRVSVFWFRFANLKSAHWFIYVAIYIALLIFLIAKLRSTAGDSELLSLRSARTPLLAIVFLAVLVGMSPYLGLRTAGAFTMFSILETEGGDSNHFFMPPELQIFDYQKQVCVFETTAEDIPKTALTGKLLTWFEFRKLTRNNPEASIAYTFKGERFELQRIADKPELTAEPDLFERFYLVFLQAGRGVTGRTGYCEGRE